MGVGVGGVELNYALKDDHTPAHVRTDFVKKVYAILITMLLISFVIAYPFVMDTYNTQMFMQAHPYLMALCGVVLMAQVALNLAMTLEQCCGGSSLSNMYFTMMKTSPINYVFLFTYAACFGVMLGNICSMYKVQSVVMAFVLTAGIIGALTIYAVVTKDDFSSMGPYMVAAASGLCMLAFVSMFVPFGPFMHRVFAALSAVMLSFSVIYNTQLIFGKASFQFQRSAIRSVEYTVDMYAFAAYQLYLDFVTMFIYILEIVGERRE